MKTEKCPGTSADKDAGFGPSLHLRRFFTRDIDQQRPAQLGNTEIPISQLVRPLQIVFHARKRA